MLRVAFASLPFIAVSSIAAAETLNCTFSDQSIIGKGFIPPDARIVLNGNSATYRDGITYNYLGKDITISRVRMH